jgi:[ribosomal protein S18]-alanine N-acetyltransferase
MHPTNPMNGHGIRPMASKDRDAVVRLLAETDPWKRLGYTQEDWVRIFCPTPQGRETFVLDTEGTVSAIAIVRQKFLLGDYLELLSVAEWARGKGIGKELLAHIESIVFGRTANLFACVSDFNKGARDFYKKQGYQEIGPMPNFLIPGSAEILLRKTTRPARS